MGVDETTKEIVAVDCACCSTDRGVGRRKRNIRRGSGRILGFITLHLPSTGNIDNPMPEDPDSEEKESVASIIFIIN